MSSNLEKARKTEVVRVKGTEVRAGDIYNGRIIIYAHVLDGNLLTLHYQGGGSDNLLLPATFLVQRPEGL